MEPENDRFNDRSNHQADELPQALIDDLKAGERAVTLLTSRVDRAVEDMAAAQFSTRRRRRIPRPAWAAIAASLLIAVFVVAPDTGDDVSPGAVYADIDGSGRIDIADVLALARNGDSTQAQLDAFALRIVSLAGDAR